MDRVDQIIYPGHKVQVSVTVPEELRTGPPSQVCSSRTSDIISTRVQIRNVLTPSHVLMSVSVCVRINLSLSFAEKRASAGGYSSFRIPPQKDPALRLRRTSSEQDEEGKENAAENRLSKASNGTMDTH